MTERFWLFCILSYLSGTIAFGKIIGKLHGVDIQKKGSGNIGFANVRRTLGWSAGVIVLAGDMLKGFVPVFAFKKYLTDPQIMIVALLAILGHIFPLWLRFKGGKGVATGLGATLAINLWIGLVSISIYLMGVAIFRKSAPSSLAAIWSLPLLSLVFLRDFSWFFA